VSPCPYCGALRLEYITGGPGHKYYDALHLKYITGALGYKYFDALHLEYNWGCAILQILRCAAPGIQLGVRYSTNIAMRCTLNTIRDELFYKYSGALRLEYNTGVRYSTNIAVRYTWNTIRVASCTGKYSPARIACCSAAKYL